MSGGSLLITQNRYFMFERIKASKYYKTGATGWVILNNGQPEHFTGRHAAKESLARLTYLTMKEKDKENASLF